MFYEEAVTTHYLHGNLLHEIQSALAILGKTPANVTVEDLAPVDEFHIGGRVATERFLAQLNFSAGSQVLDVGCGLGGAARFAAHRFDIQVSGIDLSREYIETGISLNSWVKLEKTVRLRQGSALSMGFRNGSFDGGYMLHVGMNIADKARLFAEIYRVLRPGTFFGVYDIMRIREGALAFPVPWATGAKTSNLATPATYKNVLRDAGFKVVDENNRRDFALDYFEELRTRAATNGGPPPLGLHTLMKEGTAAKVKNMIDNIRQDYIAPVELILRKDD